MGGQEMLELRGWKTGTHEVLPEQVTLWWGTGIPQERKINRSQESWLLTLALRLAYMASNKSLSFSGPQFLHL